MSQPMIYELTAAVQPRFDDEFEEFMRQHIIPFTLATGYFRNASFARSSVGRYRIFYEAFDEEGLGEYLKNDAIKLRADILERFPEGVELSRELWEILQSW